MTSEPMASKQILDDEEIGYPSEGEDGHSPFPIVAVGASAGGVEAFQQLLGAPPG